MQQTGEYIPTPDEEAQEKQLENLNPEPQAPPKPGQGITDLRLRPEDGMRNESLGLEAAAAGWGTSRFDRGEFNPEADVENKRALEQSGFSKIMNGAAKGGVYAGTTAVQTVAGVIDGLIEGAAEFVRQAEMREQISVPKIVGQGVDNFTARTMLNIQQMSEDWFPNYKTLQERSPEYQDEWMKHIFTANFIGDSFLKNFGFTVGAMAGGAAWAKGLSAAAKGLAAANLMRGVTAAAEGNEVAANALRGTYDMIRGATQVVDEAAVTRNLGRAAKALNKMGAKRELFGSVIAAMGEGTMEGVMARNEFMEEYANKLKGEYLNELNGLRQRIIDESNETGDDTYIRYVPRRNENGDIVTEKELNKKGEDHLLALQKELAADYAKKRQWAEDQGDRIASTTFLLNLPVLTASNTFQYGRMLSGDWKSVRNLAKVKGGIQKAGGKVVAEYAGTGSNLGRFAQVAGKTLKLGAAEASEEMAQGFISSGARRVADTRMTSFNDDGYDRRVLGDLGSWYNTMMEGGKEYLSDWKNWQEGFLGLVTGVIGIPGRRWSGGIAEARRQVNEDARGSEAAANALNARVNSEKFQNAWKGYVRHMKYENEMEEAAVADDQYSWQTANDKELISDILLFANAGRLQDLKDIVDSYTDMSYDEAEERGVIDAVKSDGNATEIDNSPLETVERVKGHAKKIKDMIQTYSNMYDDMLSRAPQDASPAQVEEMVATAMNIKAFETRFLSMFDDVLTSIAPYMEPLMSISREGEKLESDRQKLQRAQEIYSALAQVYTNTGIPEKLSYDDILDVGIALEGLKEIAENSTPVLKKKIEDMQKVADDRRSYLRKLLQLEKMSPAKFTEEAQSPEKTADAVQEDRVKKDTERLQTVDDIKREYQTKAAPADREAFVDAIRTKARTDNAAKSFIKTVDAYDSFRNLLSQMHPELVNRRTGGFSRVAEVMLGDAFSAAKDENDLVGKLNNLPSLESVSATLQRMVEAGDISEDEALPVMIGQQYKVASEAIADSISDFRSSWKGTAGRESLGNTQPQKQQPAAMPDDNANPTPAVKPSKETKDSAPKEQAPAVAQEDTPPQREETPEPVEAPTLEEKREDSFSTYNDSVIPEADAYRQDAKGAVKLGWYQQSIPEIFTGEAKEVRELLAARKNASHEEMEDIDQQLLSYSLENFVQFDEAGNYVGGEEAFKDNYRWLQDQDAFRYIAEDLNKDDEVVFAIMDGAPKYNGSAQIVVGKVIARNDAGEVSQIQPLTFLHSVEKSGDYMNLAELYNAIYSDYESQEPDGDLYVFGGKKNPITSKVFGKRPGLTRYDRSKDGGKRIDELPSYYTDGPIMIMDENNQPVLLRGNIDSSRIFMPNIYPWSASHYGRVYYLAKNGNDTYTPIFVDKVILTPDMVANASDGSYLADIRDAFARIDNISRNVTPETLDASNERLRSPLKTLTGLVNLDGINFEYAVDDNGTPVLRVSEKEASQDYAIDAPAVSALEFIGRPVRLSPGTNWLESSRKNLDRIISDGLLTSDAHELRQVGVNFMFDPWDASSSSFRRILPSDNGVLTSDKNIPKAGPQKVAHDAEFGDIDSSEYGVQAPKAFTAPVGATTGGAVTDLDVLLDDHNSSVPIEEELNLGYDDLSDSSKAKLQRDGVTDADWNSGDENFRRHVLHC